MDKLQLYINISYDGFHPITSINPVDSVQQHVCDLSATVDNITYDPEQKNIFYLLKYTDQGCFIVVLRTIPDKMGDHLAAWIFVPANVVIDDEQLEQVVDRVASAVKNSKVTQAELDDLRGLFSRSYELQRMPGAMAANMGSASAYRYYGGDTGYSLFDLIGSKRYQTSYLAFSDVIVADKALAQRISGTDLTDMPVNQMVRIYPPKPSDGPYRPMIFGHPFDKAYLAPLMGTVEIVWVSDTKVDIHRSVMISQPNMRIDDINANVEPDPAVEEPAEELAEPKEETAAPVATASEPSEQTVAPPAATAQTVAPAFQRPPRADERQSAPEHRYGSQRYYRFEIPAKSASISGMIEFDVHTRSALTESPIDGYVCDSDIVDGDRINYLRYASADSRQAKLVWGAAGLLCGVLLTLLCCWIFGGSSADATDAAVVADSAAVAAPVAAETAQSVQSADAAAEQQPVDRSMAAAVQYLDTNQKWTRDELEAYPDLRGLYDDMNHLRHERLYDHWAQKLKDSRNFALVAEHSRLGRHKKPRLKSGQPTFNPDSDQTIVIRTYLNTIDP